MKTLTYLALAAAALSLAACQAGGEGDAEVRDSQDQVTPNLPAPLVPGAEAGEKGARSVLLGFARALENHQFRTAWALMGETARGDRSEAQFAAEWGDLDAISVAFIDGDIEGAAGSEYYTSQLTVTAQDAQGRPLRFEGPIVLRRVNDVPGATAAQLRWHIERLDLAQKH